MSFASEKLSKGYLRKNMPIISTHVKVREIVPYLPCLTLSDREEIEAKREISGNFAAMQYLLECLQRRENWPEEFIVALEACEHRTMAAEIRAEYDSLKTPSTPKPSCPPSVVMATVHSPPPVSPSAPAEGKEAPMGAPSPTEAPGAPQYPMSGSRQDSFSEPGAQTSASPQTSVPDPQNPSTPPPSLEITHLSPQAEAPAHQEPEENSEESETFVGVVEGGPAAVGAGCVVTAETGSPAQPESMETWRSSELSEPPSVCGVDSLEDLGSASVTMTPEKCPVQDSDPPNLSQPTQVENSVQPTAVPPVDSVDCLDIPEPSPARCRDEEDEVCLSKPGELLSVQPNAAQHATLPAAAGLSEPLFSGNISLQISDPEPEDYGTHPQGSKGSPGAPPQENHCVSDDLASFAEREAQEVLEYVGYVMEEPSIQNLASPAQGILGNAVHASQDQRWDKKNEGQPEIVVQSPSPSSPPPPPGGDSGDEELQPQMLNGKATPGLAHEQVSAHQQPTAVQLPQEPKKEASVVSLSPRTKHIMMAVGMAACAMFVAWRLKN